MNMKLELGKFTISNIVFGDLTTIVNGTLIINKDELIDYLKMDPNILEVEIEIAKPGESTRIIPIKDVIQPRYKTEGNGQVFPGFIGSLETVGEGKTHVYENCAVVTCGKIVNFQEGIIDMSGPGADYCSFSKMYLIIPLITPVCTMDKTTHEATVRLAGLKTAEYLAKASMNLVPEKVEFLSFDSFEEACIKYSDLPKVLYVYMIQSQGLMHDTYVYGLNVKGILPTFITPTEVFDGAIVSGNCAAPCHKNSTFHHQNNPVIIELLKRHGKELCFSGVLITNESTKLADKRRNGYYVQNLAKLMGIQGAIISEEGGGNPETDLMLICKNLEMAGIKTVLLTDEYAGRDGKSPGLADVTPEADAVVTNGNGNEFVTLPPMNKTIGSIESVEIITGGFNGSLHEDGSISIEIAGIMGSCCELGYENLTTRLR